MLATAILANQHSDVWDAAATLLREHWRQLSSDRQASLLETLAAAASQMADSCKRRPGAGYPLCVLSFDSCHSVCSPRATSADLYKRRSGAGYPLRILPCVARCTLCSPDIFGNFSGGLLNGNPCHSLPSLKSLSFIFLDLNHAFFQAFFCGKSFDKRLWRSECSVHAGVYVVLCTNAHLKHLDGALLHEKAHKRGLWSTALSIFRSARHTLHLHSALCDGILAVEWRRRYNTSLV